MPFRVKSRGKADQLERRYDLNAVAVVTLGPTFARRDNIVEQEQIDIISYRPTPGAVLLNFSTSFNCLVRVFT